MLHGHFGVSGSSGPHTCLGHPCPLASNTLRNAVGEIFSFLMSIGVFPIRRVIRGKVDLTSLECRPIAKKEREMRFMIIRKADAETEANVMPTTELLAEMGSYMESMVKAGVMLAGDGLAASDKGARVKFHGGKPTIIDGPFSETKELVAGFSIIQVASRQEAIDWVKKWPKLDGHGEVEIEIRQILEAEDFGDAFTPDLRETEERMRVESAALAKK